MIDDDWCDELEERILELDSHVHFWGQPADELEPYERLCPEVDFGQPFIFHTGTIMLGWHGWGCLDCGLFTSDQAGEA